LTKSKKFKTPARASIFYLLGTVGSRAIGILVTPIFTRAMDEGEFGLYSYYISILGIVSMISGIFLAPAVFYSGLGKFKGEKEDFSKTAILLSISINTLICTLLFAFNPYLGLNLQLIAILTLQGAVDTIINSELMKSKFAYNYGRVLAINLSTSVLSAAISVFLVLRLGMGAIGRAIGLLLPGAAVCLLAFPRNREKKTKTRKHLYKTGKNWGTLSVGVAQFFIFGGLYGRTKNHREHCSRARRIKDGAESAHGDQRRIPGVSALSVV
jgi:O-antigen/teichoic acid export membrane protein